MPSSFDLRIHFVGLMMWVPDGETAMHVLMPSTEGHNHGGGGTGGGPAPAGGVHGHQHHLSGHPAPPSAAADARLARAAKEMMAALTAASDAPAPLAAMGKTDKTDKKATTPMHFMRLVYDVAYENPKSTQLEREWEMVDLTGRVLDLTGLPSTGGFVPNLPDELASLDKFANPVPRIRVEQMPAPPVAARVTMSSGVLSDYEMGAPFTFADPDEPQRIAPVTEWTIRGIPVPDDKSNPLKNLIIKGPGATDEHRLPPLYPIGQTIHLTLYHMVSKEFPPHNLRFRPEAQGNDDHFDAYFDVATPIAKKPLPPQKSAGFEVGVRGALVKGEGKEDPGSICGQAKAKLA